jgi:hypothetical protein
VSGYHGGHDYWVVKLDSIGNIQWQKCLGGSDFEIANSIEQTMITVLLLPDGLSLMMETFQVITRL